jgi:hypothetical protein
MGTTATDQFMSSTYCAKRWAMNLGPNITGGTPGGVSGYMIELLAFGDQGHRFLAVIGYRNAAGDYRMRIVRVHPDPAPLDFNDLNAFVTYVSNNTYMKINLPASVDTDEECVLVVERCTGMIMHGKLGPHNAPEWKAKWENYTSGVEEL